MMPGREQSKKNKALLILAGILEGLSLSCTLAFFALSLWFISSVSVTPSALMIPEIILGLGILAILPLFLRYAREKLSRDTPIRVEIFHEKNDQVLILWIGSLVASITGSIGIYRLNPSAALVTFSLLILTFFLITQLAKIDSKKLYEDHTIAENILIEKITSTMSNNIEAQLFRLSGNIENELRSFEQDLVAAEKRNLKFSGISLGSIFFIMSVNVILNAILAIKAFDNGALAGVHIAIIILGPIIIYSYVAKISSLLRNQSGLDQKEKNSNNEEIIDSIKEEGSING